MVVYNIFIVFLIVGTCLRHVGLALNEKIYKSARLRCVAVSRKRRVRRDVYLAIFEAKLPSFVMALTT